MTVLLAGQACAGLGGHGSGGGCGGVGCASPRPLYEDDGSDPCFVGLCADAAPPGALDDAGVDDGG